MWNKIYRVYSFQMKQMRSAQRVIFIFILINIFVFSNLQGVLDFSLDAGISVTPWSFSHITSDYICQLVIMAGAVALFCDAPFKSDLTKYILPRAGYFAWSCGHCIYILVLSFLYISAILLSSILSLLPNMHLESEWGKIWGTLARTVIGSNYNIPFIISNYIIGVYTPLQATTLSYLLSWCCCVWLGLITYLFNTLSNSYAGTFIAAGCILMDITVANEWLPWFYKISPVTLSQLQALMGNDSLYKVTLEYAICFFGISIAVLLVGCVITPKIQSVRRKRK